MTSTAYVHGLNFCTGTFAIIMDADFSHHVSVTSQIGLTLAQIHPRNDQAATYTRA